MKNIVRSSKFFAALLLGASTMLHAANTVGLKIDGTWLITVNVNPPSPGVPAFSFTGLNTFLSNGSLISTQASNPTPQVPPGPQPVLIHLGSGHGEWILVGDHLVVATVYLFRFDQNNQFVGVMRIRQTITLAPALDQYTATFSGDVFDANGNLTATVTGTGKATRVDVLYPDAH